MFLGLVPGTEPSERQSLRAAAEPALRLVDRLGFPRSILASHTVATPACGLAGASSGWVRHALKQVRDLGKAFVEPPESW